MLTNLYAFAVMQYFFDKYYWSTLSDDFGSMLGGLMMLENNQTADPAYEKEWFVCVKKIVPDCYDGAHLTVEQIYAIVKEFLERYCRIGFSTEVQQLIDRMKLDQNGNISDAEIKKFWDQAVALATSNGPMYLQLR
jgi:hypothetical protein